MLAYGIPLVMVQFQFVKAGVMQIGEVIQTLGNLLLNMSSPLDMEQFCGVANDSRSLPYLRLRQSIGLHTVLHVKGCG